MDIAAVDAAVTKAKAQGARRSPRKCRAYAALAQFRRSVEQGRDLEAQWHRRVDGLRAADPQLADKLRQTLAGELPKGWDAAPALPRFTPGDGEMATRDAGQKTIVAFAHNQLTREGVASRVVSMPCWDLFQAQPQSHKDVLPLGVKARVSVEAGSPLGWERYVGLEGAIIGLNRFGASAPGEIVMRELGFTPEHIVKVARSILAGNRPG